MRNYYGATLACSSCGRKFREDTSPSGFRCPRSVDDDRRRKENALEKKVAANERGSIRAWRMS
jgi:hypothetical protein